MGRAADGGARAGGGVLHGLVRGGMYNVRISIRQRVPGEARNAIAAVFGSLADVKHVFVVDDDIDVFSDAQVDWALATRFQADRDLSSPPASARAARSLAAGSRTGAKAGFDCTKPFGKRDELRVPRRQRAAIARASAPGRWKRPWPMARRPFLDLMSALGTRDGREVLRAPWTCSMPTAAFSASRTGATPSTADDRDRRPALHARRPSRLPHQSRYSAIIS